MSYRDTTPSPKPRELPPDPPVLDGAVRVATPTTLHRTIAGIRVASFPVLVPFRVGLALTKPGDLPYLQRKSGDVVVEVAHAFWCCAAAALEWAWGGA